MPVCFMCVVCGLTCDDCAHKCFLFSECVCCCYIFREIHKLLLYIQNTFGLDFVVVVNGVKL